MSGKSGSNTSHVEGTGWKQFGSNLVAGGLSGILAKTVAAPIDRVKLLLQTQSINTTLQQRYLGPINCIQRVFQEQGLTSFWRGNLANVYRYFPTQAMNFAFKDRYKVFFFDLLVSHDQQADNRHFRIMVSNLLAGGCAGGSALLVSYPFDVARTKLATDVGNNVTQQRKYRGTFECLRTTYHQEGFRGVYAGAGISLVGAVLFRALYMGGYDALKYSYDMHESSVFNRFLLAQTLTTVVGTLLYPIDTVKRRMMIHKSFSTTSTNGVVDGLYNSSWHCFQRIMKEEGVRALYSGLSVNIVRGVSGSILLVGYDEFKVIFAKFTA